jgi:cytochrome c5
MRTATGATGLIGVLLLSACASAPPRPVASVSTQRSVAGSELPAGAGKAILQTACTVCHDLGEVTKFRGYYDRQQWHDIVATMVEYGAKVDQKQIDVLTDYLTRNLGR